MDNLLNDKSYPRLFDNISIYFIFYSIAYFNRMKERLLNFYCG